MSFLDVLYAFGTLCALCTFAIIILFGILVFCVLQMDVGVQRAYATLVSFNSVGMSAINLEYNIPSVGIFGLVNYDMIEEEMCLAYNTMYHLTPEMLNKVVGQINGTQNNAILQQFIKVFKDDFALNIHITDERFKILIKKIVDLHY